jgi:hypothetical protein
VLIAQPASSRNFLFCHIRPLSPSLPAPADVCLGPIVKLWAPAGVQGEKTIVSPFAKTGTYFLVDPGGGGLLWW